MIKAGYSLLDIETMSSERYSYISYLIIKQKTSGKENPLEGGI